jgi:basic membrane lipoprotein Med (substrate-binding protein (PBP1-ABC) superfamily)
MKGAPDIVSAIHALRQGYDHFQSFQREHPGTRGAALMKQYAAKVEWIYTDLVTHPFLSDEVRAGMNKEWKSDVFAVPAIAENLSLLNPEQRELIENLIEAMLNGQEIKFVQ